MSIKEVWNEDVTENWQTVSQGLFTHPHQGKKWYEAFGLLQLKHFHNDFLS